MLASVSLLETEAQVKTAEHSLMSRESVTNSVTVAAISTRQHNRTVTTHVKKTRLQLIINYMKKYTIIIVVLS